MANYPTFQSVTATAFGSDTTAHAANYPATVTSGDLLVAFAAFDSAASITTPSGWTLLFHDDNGTIVVGTYIKRAGGTEGGTTENFVTSGVQQGTVQIYRATNWSGSLNSIGMARVSVPSSGALNLGLRMAFGSQDYLWLMAQHKSSTGTYGAGDGGWTGSTTSGQDAVTGAAIASAYKTDTVAGEISFTPWIANIDQIWLMIGIPPVGIGSGGGYGTGGTPSGGGKPGTVNPGKKPPTPPGRKPDTVGDIRAGLASAEQQNDRGGGFTSSSAAIGRSSWISGAP